MGRVQYTIITVIEESEKGRVYLASAEGYDGPVRFYYRVVPGGPKTAA